jgi:protein phosphatase PTC7
MGGTQSSGGGDAARAWTPAEAAAGAIYNWGLPPDSPPDDERNPTELVLQSWASCRAKPTPSKNFRSDVEERDRRATMAWRKRASFIELDCGEDSFFVANTYRTIGVADGVGGWRDEGYDASVFANELMRLSKLYAETHRRDTDPEAVLEHAFGRLKHEQFVRAGSSTALIASLRDIGGKTYLDVANLGDSGLFVIREDEVVHRVHEKVHGINAPFQLAVLPPAFRGKAYEDAAGDSVREQFEVREGDVVVMGTDGLFDNRFTSQIAADARYIGASKRSIFDQIPGIGNFLKQLLGKAEKTGFADPYRTAQRIVNLAQAASTSPTEDTPWSRSLRQFGVAGAEGGKVDDITLVLARVVTRDFASQGTLW